MPGTSLIVTLAAGHYLPDGEPIPSLREERWLAYLRTDTADTFRRSTSYLDRILRGEKSGELPIQVPANLRLPSTSGPQRRLVLKSAHLLARVASG
jgi:putative ABC transport system substrate-binding protein